MKKSIKEVLKKNFIPLGTNHIALLMSPNKQFAMSNMLSIYLDLQDCHDLGICAFLQSDRNDEFFDYSMEWIEKRKRIMKEMGCDTWEKCNKKMKVPFHDEVNLLVLRDPNEKFLKKLEKILPLIKEYNIYYLIDCCGNDKLLERLVSL